MSPRTTVFAIVGTLVAGLGVGAWMYMREDSPRTEVNRTEDASRSAASTFHQSPVGQPAPEFELKNLVTGRPTRLSETRGRPTVLLFGSFSCDLFCSQVKQLVQLHRDFGTKVNFLFVYIREAGHANTELDDFLSHTPGKSDRASAGLALYGIEFPCLDGRDSEDARRYFCWPERLFVLDAEGIVFWDSTIGTGSRGLRLGEAEEQLRKCLAAGGARSARVE